MTKKSLIIIQARMNSKRMPGKVLRNLKNVPTLKWLIEAAKKVNFENKIVVGTSSETSDDILVEWCKTNKIDFYRGSLNNVLRRFVEISNKFKSEIIVRLTADCPFIDPKVIDQLFYLIKKRSVDYVSNTQNRSWPDGLDCEVFTRSALLKCYKNAKNKEDLEHVTRYFYNNKNQFKCINLPFPIGDFSNIRITLDDYNDYKILKKMANFLDFGPNFMDTISIFNKLTIKKANKKFRDGNIYYSENKNFRKSNKIFKSVEAKIPLASQTFSKSYIQLPYKNAPLFITHGKGSYLWDVDGNQYIDFMMGLHSVILGYCDKDVDEGIKEQLDNGINFSLASTLEKKLADILIEMIPSAEMVRFGKNGTDANTGAIRLVREIQRKPKIITCGYHGWNDWYISSTSFDNGIPKDLKKYILPVEYNNIDQLNEVIKKNKEDLAAIIMEPMNAVYPKNDYLKKVRELSIKNNVLLIFDEIITGFRFGLGGAQEYFGVTPDITTIGKGMGNGMPISAIVGKKKFMHKMDKIFFSSTFGGESLSLRGSIATIEKIKKKNVPKKLFELGTYLDVGLKKIIKKHNFQKVISFEGHPCWKIMKVNDSQGVKGNLIKTLLIKGLINNGILINASHNISFSHKKKDLDYVIKVYDKVIKNLKEILGSRFEELKFPPIKPIFMPRKIL